MERKRESHKIELEKFTPGQIVTSGAPVASVVLASGFDAAGLTFASDGTLWFAPASVFGPSGGLVLGLAPAQLATSGSPTPAHTLNANAPNPVLAGQLAIFVPPNEVTFDANGNLWSAFDGFSFEFAASTLHDAGTGPAIGFQVYPAESAGGQTELLPGNAVAFDSAGDLVTNSINNNTAKSNVLNDYTPAEYRGTSPSPSSKTFGSSVPAFDGTHLGNYLISGPAVEMGASSRSPRTMAR